MKLFLRITLLLLLCTVLAYLTYTYLPIFTALRITSKINNTVHTENNDPLSIEFMRTQKYDGSDLVIERVLSTSGSYSEYIASYRSEGLKIFGLLTVPNPSAGSGQVKPSSGWPVIVFNHGYITPSQYRTNERYTAYVNGFANQGYIVFKPDYRGHGSSEGNPEGAYFSPAYTVDVLNAVGSLKRYKDADPTKIGMWGHSLGGNITQRVIVVSNDIKAAVIWGGVVGSYTDMYELWFNKRQRTQEATAQVREHWRVGRVNFTQLHGTPDSNPTYWNTIDPAAHLQYINTPIQLHHARADETVNYQLSEELDKKLTKAGKPHELHLYEDGDHNLTSSFNIAMQRSVEFFDKYLK